MKKPINDNLKTLIILILMLVIIRQLNTIPWWSFVLPVAVLGIILTVRRWKVTSFGIGFLAGFLTWVFAGWYFDYSFHGFALDKLGAMLAVPTAIILVLSGITGGLLTGLALYSGKALVMDKQL